jgi:hypothetical protein
LTNEVVHDELVSRHFKLDKNASSTEAGELEFSMLKVWAWREEVPKYFQAIAGIYHLPREEIRAK